MKIRILFLLVGVIGLVGSALAVRRPPAPREPRPGDVDMAFGREGVVLMGSEVPFGFERGIQATKVNAVVMDPATGDIFAAGFLKAQTNNFAIWKFNAQGAKDGLFGARGAAVTDFGNSTDEEIKMVRLLPSSKILAGGLLKMNGRKVVGFARYNADGTLDAAFGQNGKRWLNMPAELGDIVLKDLIVDSDGRLIVAGSAMNAARKPILFLARLLSDHGFDPSFNRRGYLTRDLPDSSEEAINAVAQGEDGTIFVGGHGFSDRKVKFLIGMVTSDGSGSDFMVKDADSRILATVQDILVDSEGRLLVAGDYNNQFALARYLPNGDPDQSFGENGMALTDVMADARDGILAISSTLENKIVAVGATVQQVDNPVPHSETTLALAQYNSDGSLDESFGDAGKATTDIPNTSTEEATAAAVTSANKIVTGAALVEGAVSQGLLVQYLGSAVEVAEGGAGGGGVAPGGGAAPGAGAGPDGAGAGGGGEVAAGGDEGHGDVPGVGGGGGPAGSSGGGCMLILK